MESNQWPPQPFDVALLNGIVYVYVERPFDRKPWVPVTDGGAMTPALLSEQMKGAQLLVREGSVVCAQICDDLISFCDTADALGVGIDTSSVREIISHKSGVKEGENGGEATG